MIMYVKTPNQGSLNMRDKPNTKGMILKKIPNGTILEAKIDGDWAKVTYSGETGYVMVNYLTDQDTSVSVTKEDLQKVYDGLQAVLKTIENILK